MGGAPRGGREGRASAREAGAADGGAGGGEKQTGYDRGAIRWQRLAAEGSPAAVVDMAMVALGG